MYTDLPFVLLILFRSIPFPFPLPFPLPCPLPFPLPFPLLFPYCLHTVPVLSPYRVIPSVLCTRRDMCGDFPLEETIKETVKGKDKQVRTEETVKTEETVTMEIMETRVETAAVERIVDSPEDRVGALQGGDAGGDAGRGAGKGGDAWMFTAHPHKTLRGRRLEEVQRTPRHTNWPPQ